MRLEPRDSDDSKRDGGQRPQSIPKISLDACSDVIAGPPPAVTEIPSRDTLLTMPWVHADLHDTMPSVPVHVIGTYYGAPAPRVWKCGNQRFEAVARPGGIGVVPAEWGGRWDIEGRSSISYVFLSDQRLQAFADQLLPGGKRLELVPCVGEPDPIGSHILRCLSRYATRPEQSASLFVEQGLDLLCFHLLRTHSSLVRTATPTPQRGLLSWQVRRVMAYMRDRLDRNIGLDELAAQVKLSRFHFCTAFRIATGRTPYETLVAMRIERARELLADPRLTVTEIALAVGYKTPSAFTASFRKVVGVTPSQFRSAR